MLPGIFSDDRKYIAFLSDLSTQLNEELPAEIDEYGMVGDNGIDGDFSKLRTLSGYSMTPLTYLPNDNQAIADDLDLASDFANSRQREIFKKLVANMWGSYDEVNFRIPRNSSSGFPFFIHEDDEKRVIVDHVFENSESILDMVMEEDLVGLAREHGIIFAYFLNTRAQVDDPGKKRMVNDLKYAKTGGREGSRFAASKDITLDGSKLENFNAQRMRTVCGMSLGVNALINALQYPIRSSYNERLGFAFHHGDKESRLAKVHQYNFHVDLDVTQFDQSVQAWMIDAWLECLEGVLDPRMIKLYKLAHYAPFFQPSVDGKAEGEWIGDPLNINDFSSFSGLLSGIGTVSDLGKLFMTFNYLVTLDNVFGDVLEFGIEPILQGKHELYAILDMGDDARILFKNYNDRDKLIDHIRDDSYKPYFSLDIEHGGSFVGDVAMRGQDGKIDLVPSIRSYFENFLVAERGIDSKFRQFWYLGYTVRKMLFSTNPSYQEAERISQEVWAKHFDIPMNVMVDKFALTASELLRGTESIADYEVLIDPNKIHYKYKPSEISDHIMDQIVMSLPFSYYEHVFNSMYLLNKEK